MRRANGGSRRGIAFKWRFDDTQSGVYGLVPKRFDAVDVDRNTLLVIVALERLQANDMGDANPLHC